MEIVQKDCKCGSNLQTGGKKATIWTDPSSVQDSSIDEQILEKFGEFLAAQEEIKAAIEAFQAEAKFEDDETQTALAAFQAANQAKLDALTALNQVEGDETQAAIQAAQDAAKAEDDETQELLTALEASGDDNAQALATALAANQAANQSALDAVKAAIEAIEDADDTNDDRRPAATESGVLCVTNADDEVVRRVTRRTVTTHDESGLVTAEAVDYRDVVTGEVVQIGDDESVGVCPTRTLISTYVTCAENGLIAEIVQPADNYDVSQPFPYSKTLGGIVVDASTYEAEFSALEKYRTYNCNPPSN